MGGLEEEAAALTGKDNKKARTEKSKEASSLKSEKMYVDACKVVKGLEPPNGGFVKSVKGGEPAKTSAKEEPVAEEVKKEAKKEDKKPAKKQESAGLSKAERDELEKLKGDIIARKAELKAQGLSGGACNKDEEVVKWVTRMTELKIKEDPTLAEGDKKKNEDYRLQLKSEFGYSDKDIKADPDMMDML